MADETQSLEEIAPPAAHPQHPPSDHGMEVAAETQIQPTPKSPATRARTEEAPEAQTQPPPNNPTSVESVALNSPAYKVPDMNLKMLRAIVNQDIISLKRILGIRLGPATKLIPTFSSKIIWRKPETIAIFYFSFLGENIARVVLDKLISFKIKIFKKALVVLDKLEKNIIFFGNSPVEQNGNATAQTELDPEALWPYGDRTTSVPVTVRPERNVLQGKTHGSNNALHIAAGVTESAPPQWLNFALKVFLIGAIFNLLIAPIVVLFFVALIFVGKDLEIAEIIYKEDPSLLTAPNDANETPLLCAAKAGKHRMVALFIELVQAEGNQERLKLVLRARNALGETALHEASRSGYSYVVEVLMDADKTLADLPYHTDTTLANLPDRTDTTLANLPDRTDTTLANLPDPNDIPLANSLDNKRTSPLYLAAVSSSVNVVRVLKGCGSPVSHSGPDGQTALHAAVLRGDLNGKKITRILLEWKQELVTVTDEEGNTPLHYAAYIGNSYAVREMLSQKTDAVYIPNKLGSFPVHLAAEMGNFNVISEMLKKCPDVGELLDKKRRNLLHVAVRKGRLDLVRAACSNGVGENVINAKDDDGNTPLHLAVIGSESEIFALLSQTKTMNPNIRNKKCLTPLDIAAALQDEFTHTLSPQSIIYGGLLQRGAFQNPCQPNLSKRVADTVKRADGARTASPSQGEGEELSGAAGIDTEKESTKYDNMSKSLITGAVLIASAAFVAIFTVSKVYSDDQTSLTLIKRKYTFKRRHVFKAFVVLDVTTFVCAVISTSWLLKCALTNFHIKHRKFYFKNSYILLYWTVNLFILTFGLGAYIAVAPTSDWLANFLFCGSLVAIVLNVVWHPEFVTFLYLAPYLR